MEPTGALVVAVADGDCALALVIINAAPRATTITITGAFTMFIFPRFACSPIANRDRILLTDSQLPGVHTRIAVKVNRERCEQMSV
jgi:hypothetical protein